MSLCKNYRTISISENKVVFTIETTLEKAKAIRDALFRDIPTLAIDVLHIALYDGLLTPEEFALRLGHLIIRQPEDFPSTFPVLGSCCQEGKVCKKCSVVFHMSVTNDSAIEKTVTQLDFTAEDPAVFDLLDISKPVPLTILPPGGSILLDAFVIRAGGAVHSKWIPVLNTTIYRELTRPDILDNQIFEFTVETTGRISPEECICQVMPLIFCSG